MRRPSGFEQIIITIVVVIVVFIPLATNVITKNASSESTGGINIKVYHTKLMRFNAKLNQAFIMIEKEAVGLCRAEKVAPEAIMEIFKRPLGIKKSLPADYINQNAPRVLYKNENSKVNLNLDAAAELSDGNIIGFKTSFINPDDCFEMYIDFNGLNGPNMIGIDTHMLRFKKSSRLGFTYKPAGAEDEFTCESLSDNIKTSLGCIYLMFRDPDLLP